MKLSGHPATTQHRLLAGAGALVFFAVFFAIPLYAAAALCAMPCCHEDNAASLAVSAGAPACATDCVVRSDEMTAAAKAHFVAPENRVVVAISAMPLATLDATAIPMRTPLEGGTTPAASSHPLHVLNSVFRI